MPPQREQTNLFFIFFPLWFCNYGAHETSQLAFTSAPWHKLPLIHFPLGKVLLRQLLTHLVPWHTFSKTLDQDQAWNRNKHHIAKRAALTTVINKKQTWGKRLRFVTIASSKQCYKLLKLLFLVTVGGGKTPFYYKLFFFEMTPFSSLAVQVMVEPSPTPSYPARTASLRWT